jgi:hypothetical protein
MIKNRIPTLIIVSIVAGLCLSLTSQFIWKTPAVPSVDNQICQGPDDTSSSSIQACGTPITSSGSKGFPFKYYQITLSVTYEDCDGACAQAPSAQTETKDFLVGGFILSSLAWASAIFVLVVLGGLVSVKFKRN